MNLVVKVRVAKVQGSVLGAEYAYPDGRTELHVASSNSGRRSTVHRAHKGHVVCNSDGEDGTLSCLLNRPVYDRLDGDAV